MPYTLQDRLFGDGGAPTVSFHLLEALITEIITTAATVADAATALDLDATGESQLQLIVDAVDAGVGTASKLANLQKVMSRLVIAEAEAGGDLPTSRYNTGAKLLAGLQTL